MAWQQISVITDEFNAPGVADAFSDLGAVSVTYMDAEDEPVYEPAPGETKIWTHTQVIALFDMNADLVDINREMQKKLVPANLGSWQTEIVEDQAWERVWMDYYRPMKFGSKLWVCPTGQEQFEANTVCMCLDPGLAFGTGTHPTTALCLDWLAENDLKGKIVIDYGCGSGILAVAAILLGAKQAHAVDIDPQALTATLDNAEKNAVRDKVMVYLPEQLPDLHADIVFANILAGPLCALNTKLTSLVATEGRLVLSGILAEQTQQLIDAYGTFIDLNPPSQREEWIRLDGIKI